MQKYNCKSWLQDNFRHRFSQQQHRSQMFSVWAIAMHHILICSLQPTGTGTEKRDCTGSSHHRNKGPTSEIVCTPVPKPPFCKRRFNLSGITAGTCMQKGSLAIKPDRIRGGRANEYPVCSTRYRSASGKRKCLTSFALPSVRTCPYMFRQSAPVSSLIEIMHLCHEIVLIMFNELFRQLCIYGDLRWFERLCFVLKVLSLFTPKVQSFQQ